jgi:DNA topoisomerase-1
MTIEATYQLEKVKALSEAKAIVEQCKSQIGKIININNRHDSHRPPAPFNLGDLQSEAHRVFCFSPSYTLAVAEKLYLRALISYPRTSSQKIPPTINYRKIISDLSRLTTYSQYEAVAKTRDDGPQAPYKNLALKLLSRPHIFPAEGRKTDPAHPAIYPTGQNPKGRLDRSELKIFDLITRRFLASFGEPAVSQLTRLWIEVKGIFLFRAHAMKALSDGWMIYYRPYISKTGFDSDNDFSELCEGDLLKNSNTRLVEHLTQPPSRYNQASLLRRMEKDNIGTKATRSDIISTLFKRNYISNINSQEREVINNKQQEQEGRFAGIKATEIGFEVIQTMRKYVPEIVSDDLTRSTEAKLEEIESGKINCEVVVQDTIDKLKRIINSFRKNESIIGHQIIEAIIASNEIR